MLLNIGIDENNHFVYEAIGTWGHAIWPLPVLTPAKTFYVSEGKLVADQGTTLFECKCLFREDSYDPVVRIRRGRFYYSCGQQPAEWWVLNHPVFPDEQKREAPPGAIRKRLVTFYGRPFDADAKKETRERPLILLGWHDRFTIWTVVNIEAISTGEDLVTLKARTGLGVLPLLDESKIPETYRSAVIESLERFADEVHRSAPVSVIDRARDAASHVLLAYFNALPNNAKDLGELAKQLDSRQMIIAASSARIIARLHARAKPVEKLRRRMRQIREQDAELATQCVGTILCELNWSDWE